VSYRGIGVDIVEIRRFRGAKRKGAVSKLFTIKEVQYCSAFKDPAPHFAGLFAGKEAASKALSTSRYPFLTLEIRHKPSGAPYVSTKKGKRLPVAISISHDGAYAMAIAVTFSSRTR